MTRLICTLLGLLLGFPLFAETKYIGTNPSWYLLDQDRRVVVKKYDQVTGGCWRNTANSSDRVSLELIRSGFSILSEDDFDAIVDISAMGYPIANNGCAVVAQLSIWVPSAREVGIDGYTVQSLYRHRLWHTSTILTGTRSEMSARVAKAHESQIRSFLVVLKKSADSVRAQIRQ